MYLTWCRDGVRDDLPAIDAHLHAITLDIDGDGLSLTAGTQKSHRCQNEVDDDGCHES
jgi:hypothetical protein